MRALRPRLSRLLIAASAASGLAFPTPAAADFAVFPTVLEARREPGAASSGSFVVNLQNERGARFNVVVEDVLQNADGSLSFRPASGSRFSASSWVTVSPRSFHGGADRRQPVDYRVRVPRDAEPGDHIASVTVKRQPPPGEERAPIQAVSVRLMVRVSGRLDQSAALSAFDVPRLAGGGPVPVTATVRNIGNVRLDFDRANRGSLSVLEGSDEMAALPFRGALFPGETRTFRLAWDDPPLLGFFAGRVLLKTQDGPLAEREAFLVFPWRQLGALALFAGAVIVLLLGRRRRQEHPSEPI